MIVTKTEQNSFNNIGWTLWGICLAFLIQVLYDALNSNVKIYGGLILGGLMLLMVIVLINPLKNELVIRNINFVKGILGGFIILLFFILTREYILNNLLISLNIVIIFIGTIILVISRHVKSIEIPIFNEVYKGSACQPKHKPFRLSDTADLSFELTNNSEQLVNSIFITDWFPSYHSDTSGPRHIEAKELGRVKFEEIKTLPRGSYVLVFPDMEYVDVHCSLKATYKKYEYKNYEIWGTQLITIGLAFLGIILKG